MPRSLLRGGHRNTLAPLRTTTTQHFTTTAGLLASTEAMRALAALVMGLIGTLHGNSPNPGADRIQATGLVAEGDRYSSKVAKSRRRLRVRPTAFIPSPNATIRRDRCGFRSGGLATDSPRSGVHLATFLTCGPFFETATNAGFPRLWISHMGWPRERTRGPCG